MYKTQKALRFLLLMVSRDVHSLEYDPEIQYRFHFYATWFWFATMLAAPFVAPLRGTVLGLLILEASLWANFATHFAGMSSALAAENKDISNPVQELEEFEH